MFSLQKILGKEEDIFRLLEASAQEARKSVQELVKISKTLDEPLVLDEFARLRLIDKKITQEIAGAVYTTFVTALDREDIEALSGALYKIPKMVDKFTERLLLSPPSIRKTDFSVQISLLERATDLVVEMVRSLRKEDLKQIKELNEKLQFLESEADRQLTELYRQLYNGQHPVLEVIALKDLYEQLEKVIDRCRDAGSVIAHIGLKNS
jgi:uncharacterized protein Yka (UPF0111/DUF47 family)